MRLETATFAGGCFWCIEAVFENAGGVVDVVSGYTGGWVADPTYEEVSSGTTGHYEAVQIRFDPEKTDYTQLLVLFFRQIDPTDDSGSFVDRGPQYRSAIFYHNQDQKNRALGLIEEINNSGHFSAPVATQVIAFERFYSAEDFHQNFHKNNPDGYAMYRLRSGRDLYLDKTWGKNSE
ncbi:MAG TPA: peptide-methionine (S)-S-oxide reductase MsrA [Desulfobacteraceae bacterium]|nr:peptide-methionine (S)-S-oxide reductase MsrA [Desulfobacteraceae bacterium]